MTPTALLIMDVQQGIVDRFASDETYLPRLASAISAARAAGIRVIYVTVAFRPGYPEVSEHNRSFAAIAGTGRSPTPIRPSACRPRWLRPRAR